MATSHNATFAPRGYYHVHTYVKGRNGEPFLYGILSLYVGPTSHMTVKEAIERAQRQISTFRNDLTLDHIGVRWLGSGEIKYYKPNGRRFYPQPKRK